MSDRWLPLGLAAFALMAPAGPGRACDSSGCSLISRGQNGLIGKGDLRFDLSYRYTDDSVPLEGSQETDAVYRPKVAFEQGLVWPQFHREVEGHEAFLQLDVGYGLTRRTTLLASIPLVADRSYMVAHVGIPQADYGTTGFGDFLVGARQGIVGGLVGGLSVKLPVARYQMRGDVGGSILDPTLQPGSGSWDFVGSLQYGGRIRSWAIDWTLAGSYQLNTANDLAYRFGDLGLVALSASRTVKGPLAGSFQVKFVHEARHEFQGQDLPSTGSHFLYLAPGLRVRLPERSAVYALVQFLPYRYVNETQLAPRVAFLGGVQKTF